MLAASTLAQAATAVMVHGPAFLIPALHASGLSLAEAGLVAAAPTVGVMLTLVAWGAVADRRGERFALLTGLAATVVAVDVLVEPGLLEQAKADFEERLVRTPYKALLPDDAKPPFHMF